MSWEIYIATNIAYAIFSAGLASWMLWDMVKHPLPKLSGKYRPSELMRLDNGDEVALGEAVANAPEVKML